MQPNVTFYGQNALNSESGPSSWLGRGWLHPHQNHTPALAF